MPPPGAHPESSSPDDFAAALKKARVAAGLSQADLGKRAGLTGSYVCMLELRRKPAPAADVVAAIARALGVKDERLQERAALDRTPEPVRRKVLRLARQRLRSARRRDRLLSTTVFHMARRPGFLPEDVATAMGLAPDYRPLFGRLAERVRRAPSERDAEKQAREVLKAVPPTERDAWVEALPRLLGAAVPAPAPAAPAAPTPAPDGRGWRQVPVLATLPAAGVAPEAAAPVDVLHVDRRLWREGAFVLVADDDDAWPRVEKGDWLLLDPRAVPSDGDLVVVRHDGRACVRALKHQGPDARLDAPRADVPPLRVPRERLALVGVVRWVFRSFEGPPPRRRRDGDA